LKILFVHNYYQIPGGEDAVLKQEMDLLSIDNDVTEYSISNHNISSVFDKIWAIVGVVFSYQSYRDFIRYLASNKPDVVHVHNYFPLLSPAVFYACHKMNIPVVHTLHNYRAVCPTALLMHKDQINESSVSGSAWWTVKERVYKNSLLGSFALAAMVEFHKKIGTWQSKVSCFIALTDFAKDKYIESGWPEDKVIVKPNFIEDPFDGLEEVPKTGGYALFVGRLSAEKGVDVLLDAWGDIKTPLKIIGEGPLQDRVVSNNNKNINYLGLKKKPEVLELMQNADFIIMPSLWYEGFPMVLVESFACGTPALVSDIGSMQEIVTPLQTGLHFSAGDVQSLRLKVEWMIDNPTEAKTMGNNARLEYLNKYTSKINKACLLNIYSNSIKENIK